MSSSTERTARLAAKCQIKDLYISVIINFSGKESQMKRKYTWKQTLRLLWWSKQAYFHIYFLLMRSGYYGSHLEFEIYANFPYVGARLACRSRS